ncbi:MAG: hypothetical protein JW918_05620 [Anaerolineae bacterium]|nr:hypothetical protein [Anaerolineae bacterium]
MNTIELTQYALGNAVGILEQVTADLTQEQADWTPPGIANPIGATYWHAISSTDEIGIISTIWGRGLCGRRSRPHNPHLPLLVEKIPRLCASGSGGRSLYPRKAAGGRRC